MEDVTEKRERAIAVAVCKKGSKNGIRYRDIMFEHLKELEFLAETAGAEIVDKVWQELAYINKATVIGKGKREELKETIKEQDISLVIFDDDLSASQMRNLEEILEIKVMDRSGLILEIFVKHAKTLEAKTQVDLAQTEYLLPRLTRMWTHLSKQYGGIGTKGPGETQIETDRRTLKTKIQRLKEKLKNIEIQKEQQGKGRSNLPRFSLVGYTNSGKSTLMNSITDADVYIEDKLFATLDTTVRAFNFPNGQKALLSDTVGFIRKLPPHLVASFRSTLAEARDADVIINVIDISDENFRDHINVVNETLDHLKISDKPTILVFNKIDALDEDYHGRRAIEEEFPNSILISAVRGININGLIDFMQKKYEENSSGLHILLPYTEMQLISQIYEYGDIKERTDKDVGILLEVKVAAEKYEYFMHKFGNFIFEV